MSVLKPRYRMLSIRLSDEEYQGLKDLCETHGARSVSEIARAAMLGRLGHERAGEIRDWETVGLRLQELHGKVALLDGRLDTLDREVTRLVAILGNAKFNGA